MLPYNEHTNMLQEITRSLDGVHVAYDHTLGLSAAGGASASAAAAAPSKYRSAFFFLGFASAANRYTCRSETQQATHLPIQEVRSVKFRPCPKLRRKLDLETQMHIDQNLIIHLNVI